MVSDIFHTKRSFAPEKTVIVSGVLRLRRNAHWQEHAALKLLRASWERMDCSWHHH